MLNKLISTKSLYEMIQAKQTLHLLDTTFSVPDTTPIENHFKNRIQGARYLDLKEISDKSSSYSLMMPSQAHFIDFMRKLRIKNDDTPIVLYDMANVTSSRAWFTFQVFGRKNVVVLDGGLIKWITDRLPIVSGKYEIYGEKDNGPGYDYVKNDKLIKSFEDVTKITKEKSAQVIDARPDRVFREGHIENSKNFFYDSLYNPDRSFKSPEDIKKAFENAGVDLTKDIVNSCRTAHTASVNLFALSLIGKESYLYDGSWEEWSSRNNL